MLASQSLCVKCNNGRCYGTSKAWFNKRNRQLFHSLVSISLAYVSEWVRVEGAAGISEGSYRGHCNRHAVRLRLSPLLDSPNPGQLKLFALPRRFCLWRFETHSTTSGYVITLTLRPETTRTHTLLDWHSNKCICVVLIFFQHLFLCLTHIYTVHICKIPNDSTQSVNTYCAHCTAC